MSTRIQHLLDELEGQLFVARDHERIMAAALRDSGDWPSLAERGWIVGAAAEATRVCTAAEARLRHGNAIAQREGAAQPGGEAHA